MRRSPSDRQVLGSRIVARSTLILSIALLSLAGVAYAAGVRLNLSRSIPQGLYRRIDAPIVRGSLVLTCLPRRIAALARERDYVHQGSCGDGSAPVGKTVVAVANDV